MVPCILIVDDDKNDLQTNRKIMKRYEFFIRSTTRLNQMKEAIEKNEIDCIHTDILFKDNSKNNSNNSNDTSVDWNKPNGLSEVSEVLDGRTDIPVMVISGFIDEEAKQKAEEYGISHIIYEWYPKGAVSYDLIALDTIKAINELKSQTGDTILEQLRKEGIKITGEVEGALKKITMEKKRVIKLKPAYILDSLENICHKILGNFDVIDLKNLKKLITSHLYDYFCTMSYNHFTLAEHVVEAISQTEEKNILTEDAVKLILDILKKLKRNKISDDEIENTKEALEEAFKIELGILALDIDKYAEIIDDHDASNGL